MSRKLNVKKRTFLCFKVWKHQLLSHESLYQTCIYHEIVIYMWDYMAKKNSIAYSNPLNGYFGNTVVLCTSGQHVENIVNTWDSYLFMIFYLVFKIYSNQFFFFFCTYVCMCVEFFFYFDISIFFHFWLEFVFKYIES